ncbi:hypothetical protein L0F63_000167 [Massospora cicadina]|nr:hypothetical protein L0F63_000167 [Massospora cicadina]
MAKRLSTKSSVRSLNPVTVDDLVDLKLCDSDSVTNMLYIRYQADTFFTQIGSRILVSVNPLTDHANFDDATVKRYVADYRNFTSEREVLPPHIFALANDAYLHIRRSGLDQVVIFTGDSGSGKTVAKRSFLRQLSGLRANSKKETKVLVQIINADSVLASFGSSATAVHAQASQFASYVEIQFDTKGRTIGAKHLDYILDKTRVTPNARGDANFLVFYQLLAGLTDEERGQFQLGDVSDFHYLRGSKSSIAMDELRAQFQNLKSAMRSLGFTKKFQSQVFQVLAAILHLGNIRFADPAKLGGEEAALVANGEVLTLASDLLGLHPTTLEEILIYKAQTIKKETCTVFLNAIQAAKQRDDLAVCLYSLLFSWIVEHINTRLCYDQQTTFIGLLDIPGFQNAKGNGFEQFCVNFFNERLYNYLCYQVFEASNDAYAEDHVSVPIVHYRDNHAVIQLLTKSSSGLVATIRRQANRSRGPATDSNLLLAFQKTQGANACFSANPSLGQFTIKHFFEPVVYDVNGFIDSNLAAIGLDFVQTFRGEAEAAVGNAFVSGLFNNSSVSTEAHPRDSSAIVSAQKSALPKRQPTMKRSRPATGEMRADLAARKNTVVASQLQVAIDELFDTFDSAETWFVMCLHPGARVADWSALSGQVERYGLPSMAERKRIEYTVCYLHDEFNVRYRQLLLPLAIDLDRQPKQICEAVRSVLGWGVESMAIGSQYVYLRDDVWRELEDHLRAAEQGERNGRLGLQPALNDDAQSFYSDDDAAGGDDMSQTETDTQMGDVQLMRETNHLQVVEATSKPPQTAIRKSWICCTWALTWWIPGVFLGWCGRMKRSDVRMAWREKVALCIIIFTISALVVFFIAGVNPLVCPERDIYSVSEVLSSKGDKKKPLYHLYGRVYDMSAIRGIKQGHYRANYEYMLETYSGENLDHAFPIQINPNLCLRYDGQEIHQAVSLSNVTIQPLLINHDHRWYRGDLNFKPYWFEDVIRYRMKKVGELAYTQEEVEQNPRRKWVIYDDRSTGELVTRVYDFTPYFRPFILTRPGEGDVDFEETRFLGEEMESLINTMRGRNITQAFNEKIHPDKPEYRENILRCMNNLFYAGVVDDRNSIQCIFAQYVLLALSVFLFTILLVKFLASLQLGSRPSPEDHDKFVICNVPCYTEDDESLRRTIDSLAVLKYDDKRKLLFIIADGMVIGGGNDVPTPRIVLDLLGSDPGLDPEPLSFLSLGEGSKQHNMGKVYTGLYEVRGHVVPYLVVVKVGKPSERSKPGNRGKRDSQLILMRFFNKVHYDHPMVPLELEMYHQIKNVIGVDPHFYEYVLMVDADTVVMPDSLNRLVSAMQFDANIMGVCGETSLMNEKATWATMIQVYEYFISHHLAKAFESLFGSVTCLPGCFSMYRLRSPATNAPLLISNVIIDQYAENRVDTLHKKNLLHLGEDRYLTTLLLKNFPFQKMKFTPDAKCITNAPDTWGVLLSQRRRWINSTIHNLLELVLLPRLCGFCCFSMRFVVFLDLLSTIIMPATLGYLGYLIYRLVADRDKTVSLVSLFFILAPFGLQVLVFLIRRQWQHIGWMVIYLLALPVFAFFIPVYSFWHFDDFSWGNTRIVLGEGGKKKKVAADDSHFDPRTIPTRRWAEYEEEAWEAATEKTHHSSSSSPSLARQINNVSPQPFAPPALPDPGPYYAPAPMEFRPASPMSFLPMPAPQLVPPPRTHTPRQPVPLLETYAPPPSFPHPVELVEVIRGVLNSSDLMSLSKKQVRQTLAAHYALDFDPHKDQINAWIELILLGQI